MSFIYIRENQVFIKNPDISDAEKTYLTVACAASAASISVADYSGFADNDYLVLGIYSKEKAEIVLVDDVAIDATITLDATDLPAYAHPANTQVIRMPYNQIKIWSAASEAACLALTTSDAVLATTNLQVDDEYTSYDDTTGSSTTWYKVAFYNSGATTYSDFSDPIQATGYKANSRGRLKGIIRSLFGDKYGKWVDETDLNNFFYQVETEVFDYRKKWSFLQTESTFTLTAGVHKYVLSTQLTDIKAPTKDYIENIWIGDNDPFAYNDRKEFDSLLEGAQWTTLSAAILTNATTVYLTDGSKLNDSGTCYINGDDIAYTDITTNTMTAGAGEVDADHASGSEVWQSTELDEPTDCTVWGSDLFVYPCPDDSYITSVNYYKKGVPMDSDNDVSEIPASVSLLVSGVLALCFQAKGDNVQYKEKRAEFLTGLKEMSYKEKLGQGQSLTPSDEEGYKEWEDYTDFDKGSLKLIRNRYRSS